MRPSRSKVKPGDRFGRITALEITSHDSRSRAYWRCRCDCGRVWGVRADGLLGGRIISCGCWRREVLARVRTKHGVCRHPGYPSWLAMRYRCGNKRAHNYADYGGRGIKVCERWRDARNFFADMGDKPAKEMKLCRFNMDGDYEPGNCYWGTAKEASGSSTHAIRVLIDGRAVSMNQAGKLLGMGSSRRLYCEMEKWGLTHQEAVDRFAKREDMDE